MDTPSIRLRKGAWTAEEDSLLRECIDKYGEGKWHQIPLRSGLNRCRKSCRLRWLNYLKPCIKRGKFSSDEIDLLVRLHKLLGNRWSLIAGRLPGRTANDIKNYWNTHLSKKPDPSTKIERGDPSGSVATSPPRIDVLKPQPQYLSKNVDYSRLNGPPEVDFGGITIGDDNIICNNNEEKSELVDIVMDDQTMWWDGLLEVNWMDSAAMASDKASSSTINSFSSMCDFEQLWSLLNEETGDLD